MSSEELLSIREEDLPDPGPITTYVPALVAASFAWTIALIRALFVVLRSEGPTLDAALAALLLVAIPLTVVRAWQRGRRAKWWTSSNEPRAERRRPHLVLVSHH
jgi:hypothetical protein